MLHSIFSIYDSKIEAYLPPFFMQTKAASIRAITDTMQDQQHPFSKHPEDYTLFFLGTYDDNNSKFDIEITPQSLAVMIELIEQSTLKLVERESQ